MGDEILEELLSFDSVKDAGEVELGGELKGDKVWHRAICKL